MKLILVRHGETEENLNKTVQGHRPGKLTTLGIEQAVKLGKRFKGKSIDVIYCSDLARCVDTAKEIIKYHLGVPFFLTKEIREQGKGSFEGQSAKLRNDYLDKIGIPWYQYDYKKEGGESMAYMQQRVCKFCYSLVDRHKNDNVLLVTHGGPITALLLDLYKEPFTESNKYPTPNTCVTEIVMKSRNDFKILTMGCVKHLSGN